jgi:hypothetical protein
LKTRNCGDSGRSNKEQQELRASREEATATYLETLDHSQVTNFFQPLIYDVGVENLDVQVYLRNICLPYWMNQYREDMVGKEVFLFPPIATPATQDDSAKPRAVAVVRNTCVLCFTTQI